MNDIYRLRPNNIRVNSCSVMGVGTVQSQLLLITTLEAWGEINPTLTEPRQQQKHTALHSNIRALASYIILVGARSQQTCPTFQCV